MIIKKRPIVTDIVMITFCFRLGLSLIIVPVVAIIDAAAIAKAFGEHDEDDDDRHHYDD